jgi:hypothetical protein
MKQIQLFNQFTEVELEILRKATDVLNLYFNGTTKPKSKRPNRVVHRTTQLFLDDVKSVYGNVWVYRQDPIFLDILHKHRKSDVSTLIKKYVELNRIEVVRNNNKNQNIIKFRFL